MRRAGWVKPARCLVLVLYALASLSIGFSHRPAQPSAADLAEFAMPDGTLPVLCLTKGDTSGRSGASKSSCKACRLIAAPGLPPSRSGYAWLSLRCVAVNRHFPRIASIGVNPALPVLGPRGPPRA